MYAVAYTPKNELSVSSVKPDNFTLTATDKNTVQIDEAFYYTENNQVKLIVHAKDKYRNKLLTLSSSDILDVNGNTADITENVYLFSEEEVAYGTLGISSITYLKDGVPVSTAKGSSGIKAAVRVCNTTGTPKSGTLAIYDGNTFVAESTFSAEGESFTQVLIDTDTYTFIGEPNVIIK